MPTRLRGVVLDGTGRTPMGGIVMEAYDPLSGQVSGEAVTNAFGAFILGGLAEKAWAPRRKTGTGAILIVDVAESISDEDVHGMRQNVGAHAYSDLRNVPTRFRVGAMKDGVLQGVRTQIDFTGPTIASVTDHPTEDKMTVETQCAFPDPEAQGSMIVADPTPEWTELPIGDAGKYLRSDGTDPSWSELAIVDDPSPQLGGNLDYNGKAIVDANGNEVLEYGSVANAIQALKVTNADDSGNTYVTLEATSDEAWSKLKICTKSHNSSELVIENRYGSITLGGMGGVAEVVFASGGPGIGGIIVLDANIGGAGGGIDLIAESINVYGEFIQHSGYGSLILSSSDASSKIQLKPQGLVALDAKPTASAVNYLTAAGGATGSPPVLSVDGSDANVDLSLAGKGTGRVIFASDGFLDTDNQIGFRDGTKQRMYSSALDTLDIDTGSLFYVRVAGSQEIRIGANQLFFNSSAGDPGFDWGTDGVLKYLIDTDPKLTLGNRVMTMHGPGDDPALDWSASGTLDVKIGSTTVCDFASALVDHPVDCRVPNLIVDSDAGSGVADCLTIGKELRTGSGVTSALYHKLPTGFTQTDAWLIVKHGTTEYAIPLWENTA